MTVDHEWRDAVARRISRILSLLDDDEDREEVFAALRQQFCFECGRELGNDALCHCSNDE